MLNKYVKYRWNESDLKIMKKFLDDDIEYHLNLINDIQIHIDIRKKQLEDLEENRLIVIDSI